MKEESAVCRTLLLFKHQLSSQTSLVRTLRYMIPYYDALSCGLKAE